MALLAARVTDKRVAGGEQMPRQLAAHVAEADKTESHGSVPALTEKVNLTLFAWYVNWISEEYFANRSDNSFLIRFFGLWPRFSVDKVSRVSKRF